MTRKNRRRLASRQCLRIVDEVVQHDDVRMILISLGQKELDLLDGIPIADASIDDFGVDAAFSVQALDPLRERLVDRNAPAFGYGVAEHHNPPCVWGTLEGELS